MKGSWIMTVSQGCTQIDSFNTMAHKVFLENGDNYFNHPRIHPSVRQLYHNWEHPKDAVRLSSIGINYMLLQYDYMLANVVGK